MQSGAQPTLKPRTMELIIDNVTKKYRNGKIGINNYNATFEKGIIGLLGPNGAGKSTLLKMIATITKPSAGKIILNKNNIVKDANFMRQQLGFLPQDFGLYPNLNAIEFLEYMAAIKGVGGHQLQQRISMLLEGLNLSAVAKRAIKTYSGGMKQRLGIAQTLLNQPKVLLFDEPTVGLDPEERMRFRDLLFELANDSIVLLSSHIVSDIDTIADKVVIMQNGKLLDYGNTNEIISKASNKVYEATIEAEQLNTFKKQFLVVQTSRSNAHVKVRYIANKPSVNSVACTANLEDAYLLTTKKIA